MDVNDLITALNGVLDVGDTLDGNGIGISAMTSGENTTREVIKMELGLFLLYVGAGGDFFNDGQEGLVNLLLSDKYGLTPAWQMKSFADDMNMPLAATNATFTAFENGDKALSRQNGTPSNQFTDLLIGLYESFGKLMVALNENVISRIRCDTYIDGLRARQGSASSSITKNTLDKKDDSKKVIADKKPGTKSVSANKKKTVSKSAGTGLAKYNDRVVFALPKGYKMQWEKDDDGDDSCKIVSTGSTDSDTPETSVSVSVPENSDSERDPFEIIQEGDDESTFIPFNSDPEALLCITYLDMQLLGMNMRTSLYRLYIRLSKKESLLLFLTSVSRNGENKFLEDFTKITDIWRSMRIDGEPVDLGEADTAKSLGAYLTELQQNGGKPKKKKSGAKKATASASKAKTQKKREIITAKPRKIPDASQYKGIHQVEDEPERISPTGTWTIPVPPGCSYTMDPDCAGGGFTGKYMAQIQATEDCDFDKAYDSRFSFAVFGSGVMIKEYSALLDLSSDESADAIMGTVSKADKSYSFFKRKANLAILTKPIDSNKNEYALIFLVITPGMQFASMCQLVIRAQSKKKAKEEVESVLNTISAVNFSYGDEGYKPVVLKNKYGLTYRENKTLTLNDGIILPVPDGYKGSTDPSLIGAPRVFSIVPKDYTDFSKAMDAMIGITAVPIQGEVPEYTPEICDQVCQLISDQFEQQGIFIAGTGRIIAQKTTHGIVFYQKTYGLDTIKYLTGKGIIWGDKSGYILSFAINLDSKIADRQDVGIDAELIMSDWMNRIKLPGEKLFYIPADDTAEPDADQIENLISPVPSDLLHEHFDLTEGHRYTTRRSADFVGQPIRMLMEKCGNEDDEACKLMEITGDTYSLDKDAITLAKVFRLNENLFEPYEDTEAMIRKGMFTDTRMLHALRSIAWMVNRFCETGNSKLSGVTYDELVRMGTIIKKRNYLNYDGENGFMNLCHQYDWHVFYVPDNYLVSDYSKNHDLRYLTGKENRGGNSISMLIPGVGGNPLAEMQRTNNIIGRNEETLTSLEGLRDELKELLPVMQTIHDGLLEKRDRSKKLDGPLADALTAWCALAIAAKEPFYSEEAADTPEADAALDEPLERPTDELNEKSVKGKKSTVKKTTTKSTTEKTTTKTTTEKSTAAKSTTKKTTSTKTSSTSKTKSAAAPKEMSVYSPEYKKAMKERLLPGEKDLPSEIYCNKIDFRAGDIAENGIRFNLLKDNGPVIEKHKYFLGKVQGAYLEIPEGVTEIESSAFSYDEFQIVKLPRSLRILKQGAFSQCPNLRKVVFQEGIRELGPIIFGECPNIKEVHLPGTVEIIDDSAFKWELLSRRSDITVYLTGASAKKVYENAEKEGFDPPFARGFVIDGKSYSNLENYIVASERERQAALERQRQEKLKRDEEARKTAQRNSLRQSISELEQERDSAKGLFAGMKRKKIQKEIDELRSQLQRI